MTLISHTNTLMTPVLGLLLCRPNFITGNMTLGEVVQAAAAFAIVQGTFNWISDSYGRLAEWASSANRVASLLLALDQIDKPLQAQITLKHVGRPPRCAPLGHLPFSFLGSGHELYE